VPVILVVGIILFTGFVFGEFAVKIRLPKVTGYIIAGVLLNPDLFKFIPKSFIDSTDIITNIALSFITFSIGGTLLYSRLKKLGRGIGYITVFEAEAAFLAVAIGFLLASPFLLKVPGSTWLTTFVPFSLLIAALASPTDPTTILAIVHEYNAKGEVSSTVMGVAAFDDALGIINYSIATTLAASFISHAHFSLYPSILKPFVIILASISLGALFGLLFNIFTVFMKKETEGAFIVLIFALLPLCFGAANLLNFDELLATMSMGVIVINFNINRDKIFKILERYTEELVFVLFFTISGMHLELSIFLKASLIVLLFIIFRTAGKFFGTFIGSTLAGSSDKVKRYTVGGLIPQGGIVVGLALLIKQNPVFANIADIIINTVIGATVIHELVGPVLSKIALKKCGEIKNNKNGSR